MDDELTTTTVTYSGPTEDLRLIADGTNPWVESQGKAVDWTMPGWQHDRDTRTDGRTCDGCKDSIMAGVLEAMDTAEGVQRCDECQLFDGDLSAAVALAAIVGGVVKYQAEEEDHAGG